MKIGVDVMGADLGPREIIKGTIDAVREYDSEIVLFGKGSVISEIVGSFSDFDKNKVTIVDAEEEILMTDQPLLAIRRKKKSSMVVGLNNLKEKKIDCFISPGNTGAMTAGAVLKLKMLDGVERPGIASILPNSKQKVSVVLDVGANVDSKPKHLLQYAVMGSEYAKIVLNKTDIKVGLLNIGEEEIKGNELAKNAHALLKTHIKEFCGNVEGRDIFSGDIEVVVCDGFTGNTILKVSEGLAETLFGLIKKGITEKIIYKAGAFLLKGFFKNFKKIIEYSEYGGAPLLGVNGNCTICHGSSKSNAIKNAVRISTEFYKKKVNEKIAERIKQINLKINN